MCDQESPLTAGSFGDAAELRRSAAARRAAEARKASPRRRLVDPTTCDREYTAAQTEFMNAMQAYKAASGRMFPTWSEALEVLQQLGYRKLAAEFERQEASPNAP